MKKEILLFATLLALGQNAFAYNFSSVAPSGQTLYYNYVHAYNPVRIVGVEVTYPGNVQTYGNYYTRPIGDLIIPDSVTLGSSTYPVSQIDYKAFDSCTGLTTPNTYW